MMHKADITTRLLAPPANLDKTGRDLWQSVMSEYDIRDSGGQQMLQQICEAADRVHESGAVISRDGPVVRRAPNRSDRLNVEAQPVQGSHNKRPRCELVLDQRVVFRPPALVRGRTSRLRRPGDRLRSEEQAQGP